MDWTPWVLSISPSLQCWLYRCQQPVCPTYSHQLRWGNTSIDSNRSKAYVVNSNSQAAGTERGRLRDATRRQQLTTTDRYAPQFVEVQLCRVIFLVYEYKTIEGQTIMLPSHMFQGRRQRATDQLATAQRRSWKGEGTTAGHGYALTRKVEPVCDCVVIGLSGLPQQAAGLLTGSRVVRCIKQEQPEFAKRFHSET